MIKKDKFSFELREGCGYRDGWGEGRASEMLKLVK